jgi:RNA polymerase sigma-70 factor (ECF subfamily)
MMVIEVMLVKTKPAFEELVEAHSGELFGYLWRLLGDEADAQDALQDTFVRALRAYERAENDNLRAWLYKIATNRARTQLRRGALRSHAALGEQHAAGGQGVDALVAERLSLAAVRAAVNGLPTKQQAALLMRKYQQLEYGEIAAALDCSEDAARAHVYQALKKLRAMFSEDGDE